MGKINFSCFNTAERSKGTSNKVNSDHNMDGIVPRSVALQDTSIYKLKRELTYSSSEYSLGTQMNSSIFSNDCINLWDYDCDESNTKEWIQQNIYHVVNQLQYWESYIVGNLIIALEVFIAFLAHKCVTPQEKRNNQSDTSVHRASTKG